MADPITESPVRYRLTPVSQGVQLEIWELAPPAADSKRSFLFRVKYVLADQQAAQAALEDFLSHNGLGFADDSIPPHEDSGSRRLLSIRDTRP